VNALSRFFASEKLFGTSILNWNEVEMPGNLEIPLRGQFGIARTSKQDVRCEVIEDNLGHLEIYFGICSRRNGDLARYKQE